MDAPVAILERSRLLAYVERHWRELTLAQARSLSVELLDEIALPTQSINSSLTYR